MKASSALQVTLSRLRTETAAILPAFFLAGSATFVALTAPVAGFLVAYAYLYATGTIQSVQQDLSEQSLSELLDTPDTGGAGPPEFGQLRAVAQTLLTPEVIAIVVLAMLGALVLVLLAWSYFGAFQVHTAQAALVGAPPVEAGVIGAGRDGVRFVVFQLVKAVALLIGVAVPLGAYLALATAAGSNVLAGLVAAVVGLVSVTVALLAFLFVPQSIVVDDVGAADAIRRNFSFIRQNLFAVGGYLLLYASVYGIIGVLWQVFTALSVVQIVAPLVWFLVRPVLSVTKTGIYVDGHRVPDPGTPARSVTADVGGAFATGLRELRGFVRRRIGLICLSILLFGLGAPVGWTMTAGLELSLPTGPLENIREAFGPFPIDTAVQLTANNWTVAIRQAFAGVAFGLPSLANLLLNGVLLGAIAGLGFDPLFVAGGILPHGVIEIPALGVSGALGLQLGRTAFGYWRGGVTYRDLAAQMQRTYYVLLGLLPVFLVAGFIEAFVTPYVASLLV
jgi:uncharacterized membrane protein SpoIIM required for sporulation